MVHPLKVLAHLPTVRRALLGVLFLAGLADFLTSIVLLAYQLSLTTGFNRVVPSLVVTSFLTCAIPVWFVYSRPYAIRLPVASAPLPKVGSKRDQVAKFTRSIMFELIALGGVGAWTLITVADLHAETPGLIHNCGGWTICRMLLAVLSLTWITILFQGLAFASLLVSTLYFSVRRHSPIPTLFTSFDEVDWVRYSGRPVTRAATVRRHTESKKNTQTVPEDAPDAELKAPSRSRFGGRPESQVPVLARSIHSTYTHGTGGPSLGGNDSITIDWDDHRSSFRDSTATVPAPAPAEPRPDQVFILVGEKEDKHGDDDEEDSARETAQAQAQEGEQVEQEKKDDSTTGTAL
ncbi:hypothetical protein JCM11491_004674 [Sporobolomyces phaffii]